MNFRQVYGEFNGSDSYLKLVTSLPVLLIFDKFETNLVVLVIYLDGKKMSIAMEIPSTYSPSLVPNSFSNEF